VRQRCAIIAHAGLPQVVACTAQNLVHRFLYRKSLKRFDAFALAMGCVGGPSAPSLNRHFPC
jgi:hypothetical protein